MAVYEVSSRGARVVACCLRAQALGVCAGMPLAEAQALTTAADGSQARGTPPVKAAAATSETSAMVLQACDRLEDRRTLEALADWSQQFTPVVAVEEAAAPECLFLDIHGCVRYFRGEMPLARRVVQQFARRGLGVHVAIADTVGAAWAAARWGSDGQADLAARLHRAGSITMVPGGQTEAAMRPMPVAALRLPPAVQDLLHALGLARVEDVLALPRRELPARFGPALLERLDQLLGHRGELLLPRRVPLVFADRQTFEEPTADRRRLAAMLEGMVRRLAHRLAHRQLGARQLHCRLIPAGGEPVEFAVGLYRVSAAAGHLFELVALRLEGIRLPGPVEGVHLAVTATGRLQQRQQTLFAEEGRGDQGRQLGVLLDRLSSRLGREAVVRPALLADAQPERAVRYEPVVALPGRKPRCPTDQAATAPAGRPVRLLRRPVPVEVVAVAPHGPPARFRMSSKTPAARAGGFSAESFPELHEVARHWGPERIETGWWRGRSVQRDYYRVETAGGERFWLFRRLTDGQWFLHGTFD